MARALSLVNLLLAAALVGFAVWGWGQLPERVPVHLDASGTPTRWGKRSFWSWYLLTLMGLATAWLTHATAAWLPRRPALLNLPNKDRLLALPPERQAPVWARIQEMLYALTTFVLLTFLLVQAAIYRAALGHDATGLLVAVLVLSVALTPVLLAGWLPRVQREIERQARAHARQVTADLPYSPEVHPLED